MWTLKSKTNKHIKLKRSREYTDTENKHMVARGKGAEGRR